jgi:hypothetical protein
MDCEAFLGISRALGLRDNSLNATNCCTFSDTFVQCDEQRYIWYIRFRATGFTGSIPSNIDQLQRLEVLSLVGNQYTGIIPPSIGNIKTLTTLWVRDNNLDGPIPATLAGLSNLQYFDISGTNIRGPIPDFLVQKHLNASRVGACPYDTHQCSDQPNKPLLNVGCAEVCSPPIAPQMVSSEPNLALILSLSIIGGLLVVAMAVGAVFFYKKSNPSFQSLSRSGFVKKPIANEVQSAQYETSVDVNPQSNDLRYSMVSQPIMLPVIEPILAIPEQAVIDQGGLQPTHYAVYYPVVQEELGLLYTSLDPGIPATEEVESERVNRLSPNQFSRITSVDLDIDTSIPQEYAHLYPPKKEPSFFERLFERLK